MDTFLTILAVIGALLVLVALYDVLQTRHAILRNFPVIGHFRYILEAIGPELRQYIVTDNDEERPFSRDQRRWVYASAKQQNNYFGFGTDNDLERSPNYLVIKHAAFGPESPRPGDPDFDPTWPMPVAKQLGGPRGRKHAFQMPSVVNVSAMSYGSLSPAAVEAINKGCGIANALHNTGEGGIASCHLHGGDLIYQLGTGYFGARDEGGRFHLERFLESCQKGPVRAVEIKLSQGAKPGKGGVLPGAKVTAEIATARGVPIGRDVISPSRHSAFSNVDSMLDFVESLAERSGLPVGIKSAVGSLQFFEELADAMARDKGRGVDYIQIDGGEGGTGAAPLVFSDHVSLPFKIGFSRVIRLFKERGIDDRLVFVGSGKLGLPDQALLAFGLGCDAISVAREPMLAIGCIQAQRCHSGHCPTGVATQNKWLMRGLDPTHKSHRLANYLMTLRKEISWLTHTVGVEHPSQVGPEHFEILNDNFGAKPLDEVFANGHGIAGV